MDRPGHDTAVPTLAVVLAGLLLWQAIVVLLGRHDAATKFRLDAWMSASASETVALVVAAIGIGAAIALLAARTRRAGAMTAGIILLMVGVYVAVTWASGEPVQCLCTSSTQPRSTLIHIETLVVIWSTAALGWFIVIASRRQVSDASGGPESSSPGADG